jgi:hypothetical protein
VSPEDPARTGRRRFVASRLTAGNFLFPTAVVITEHAVLRRKRSWLQVSEESIHVRNVASVSITTGLIWSDIRIESTGGSNSIDSHGHTKADAREIKRLIDELQSREGRAAAPAGDVRPCPHCAETIQRAARICRFCGRSVA